MGTIDLHCDRSFKGRQSLLTRDCRIVVTCLPSDMVESALWKQYRAYRVSKGRGVLYHTQAYNAQCFQMPEESALWKQVPSLPFALSPKAVEFFTLQCHMSPGTG